MNSSVVYATASRLNQGGMGTIGWHACRALHGGGLLRLVLSPDTGRAGPLQPVARQLAWPFRKAMAAMNRMGWHHLHDDFFDRWASTWLEKGTDYYGWLNQSLACIRRCRALGGRTFVDRGSVEPRLQQCWLEQEYARHGLRVSAVKPWSVKRMVREADEVDVIVAPSSLVVESYLAAGYHKEKVRLNPLGVDLHPLPAACERRRDDNVFRFVFVGQLSIQKGMVDLLRSWKRFHDRPAELVLAGVIPAAERSVTEPLLRDARKVVWNGHCDDVGELLRRCDVLVLPSAQDGFGLVVLEAFASGLPVIVSDRVGARDCVRDGVNGVIFRFGDGAALEEAMDSFLRKREKVKAMGTAALETAKEYSWERYGKSLIALIRDR